MPLTCGYYTTGHPLAPARAAPAARYALNKSVFPKGRLNIFDVPDELIHVIWDGDDVDVLERFYKPLVYFGRDDSAREVWDFSGLR